MRTLLHQFQQMRYHSQFQIKSHSEKLLLYCDNLEKIIISNDVHNAQKYDEGMHIHGKEEGEGIHTISHREPWEKGFPSTWYSN